MGAADLRLKTMMTISLPSFKTFSRAFCHSDGKITTVILYQGNLQWWEKGISAETT